MCVDFGEIEMKRGDVIFVLALTCIGGCWGNMPTDRLAPTVPTGLSITAVSSSEVRVAWKPSADDSGKVKNYKVYRNGQFLATTKKTSVSDKTLTPRVKFCFRVSAVDEAGNESSQSTEVCAIL